MSYRKLIKYLLRIFNIVISSALAYNGFYLIYDQYLSYVPTLYNLDQLNARPAIGAMIADNTIGFRELYMHIFEKSIIYSLVIFILSFLLIEYIYRLRDKQTTESARRIYEQFGAWKERNVTNNSNISKENQDYLKDYFKK